MDDNDLKQFMTVCVERVNSLNERVIFIEEQLTRLVNILGKSNIKSPHEADNNSCEKLK